MCRKEFTLQTRNCEEVVRKASELDSIWLAPTSEVALTQMNAIRRFSKMRHVFVTAFSGASPGVAGALFPANPTYLFFQDQLDFPPNSTILLNNCFYAEILFFACKNRGRHLFEEKTAMIEADTRYPWQTFFRVDAGIPCASSSASLPEGHNTATCFSLT